MESNPSLSEIKAYLTQYLARGFSDFGMYCNLLGLDPDSGVVGHSGPRDLHLDKNNQIILSTIVAKVLGRGLS